jgi:hypothetical protein
LSGAPGKMNPDTGARRFRGFGPLEAQARQIQGVDEHIDRTHRVVLIDPVVQPLRKQDAWRADLSIDVSAH